MKRLSLLIILLVSLCGQAAAQFGTGQYDDMKNYMKRVNTTVTPSADNTYDLGSSARSWKNIYLDGSIYGASGSAIGGWTTATGKVYTSTLTDYVSVGTSSPLSRMSITGTGVVAALPGSYTPNAQQLSQTVSVQGDGSAYFYAEDKTNDIETAFGASTNGNGFVGSLSSDAFELRTANTARMTLSAAGDITVATAEAPKIFTVYGTGSFIGTTCLAIGKETCTGSAIDVVGNVVVTASDTINIGAVGTDGSWRLSRSGNNLLIERRESGSWVAKQTITP